jgi:putative spermidine/putrescine transport system permease protein
MSSTKPLRAAAWLQAAPFSLVFVLFLVLPLLLVVTVSFWRATDYELIPAFTWQNYLDVFNETTVRTYLSTLKFCFLVWLVTLLIGFAVAYFLAFHVRSVGAQTLLFILCTVPFWTSNVIRMISWMPVLAEQGVINSTLLKLGLIDAPLRILLFSDFSVVLAYVHLFTIFMIVPIFNSMSRIDRKLFEAARDAGAGRFKTLWMVVLPLTQSGIVMGSIFVITLVMGDFYVVKVMSGGGSASVVSAMYDNVSTLLFPPAAASAVILLLILTVLIAILTRFVDVRQELVQRS